MSDPQSYPSPAPPQGLPAARSRQAVGGFFIDLSLAIAVMLAVSFAVFAAWGVVLGIRLAAQGGDIGATVEQAFSQPPAGLLIWVTLLGTGMAALVPYWFRRRATVVERARSLAALRRASTWGWIVLAALAVFALSASVTALGRLAGIEPEPTNQAPIHDALQASPWFVGIFVVLLAPMYEELLFRRVLFGRLWAAGKPLLGVVLSSLAFALMHEPPGMSANSGAATLMLWIIYGGMGAIFAWVYRRTGTLWAAIAAHALNNALALVVLGLS